MIYVDFEDLDTSEDGHGDVLLHGELFTGIAVETAGDGRCTALWCYRLGRPHGPSRTWYEDGSPRREEHLSMGSRTGPLREWDDRGRLRLEEVWEHQIPLWRKRWDEQGALVEDASLLNDARVASWLKLRARLTTVLLELEGDALVERPWPYDALIPPEVRARASLTPA